MILKLEDENFALRDTLPLEIFRDAYALDQVRIRAVDGVDRALKIDRRSFAQIHLREAHTLGAPLPRRVRRTVSRRCGGSGRRR